jgi:SH3 domain-containing protein
MDRMPNVRWGVWIGLIVAGSALLAACGPQSSTPTPLVLPSLPAATATPIVLPPGATNTPPLVTLPTVTPTLAPLPTAIVLPTFTQAVPGPTTTTPPLPQPTGNGSAITPGSPSGPYGVILVAANDVLNIRSGPGASTSVVGTFPPTANNVMRTGPSSLSDGDLWVEVQKPGGGTGWVNAYYLTQYVSASAFCADSAVTTLIQNLKTSVTTDDGVLLASLVSPIHGMTLQVIRDGTRVTYDAEHARWVYDSTYQVSWGAAAGSGQDVVGSFQQVVQPKLVDVLTASFNTVCEQIQLGGATYVVAWPPELANIPFDSLYQPGTDAYGGLDWQTWLLGVEYVSGRPYVFSLSYYAWEP